MNSKPSVSFVLPMFNEEENISRTIDTVRSIAGRVASDYEIVVVDDASTDGSAEVVRSIADKDNTVRLFCLPQNTRFGGALAEGFKRARKDVILYTDSDLPVSFEIIEGSLPLMLEYDVVTGYSTVKKGDTLTRKFISRVYNLMIQTLFGLSIRDINSGYKIVRKSVFEDAVFVSRSPFVDVEIFIHAKKKNCRVKQYPLIFLPREGGKSYIARLPVIWATFRDMMKVRLSLWFKK